MTGCLARNQRARAARRARGLPGQMHAAPRPQPRAARHTRARSPPPRSTRSCDRRRKKQRSAHQGGGYVPWPAAAGVGGCRAVVQRVGPARWARDAAWKERGWFLNASPGGAKPENKPEGTTGGQVCAPGVDVWEDPDWEFCRVGDSGVDGTKAAVCACVCRMAVRRRRRGAELAITRLLRALGCSA